MSYNMKRASFYAKGNRSGNLLHIETDGCVVNIRVGLTDDSGRQVTRVDILPDDEQDERYGADGQPLPHGRCDTCGAPCSADGCTANTTHETALDVDEDYDPSSLAKEDRRNDWQH